MYYGLIRLLQFAVSYSFTGQLDQKIRFNIRFSCDRCAACSSDNADGDMELHLGEPKLPEGRQFKLKLLDSP